MLAGVVRALFSGNRRPPGGVDAFEEFFGSKEQKR